jgi:hypothetical protein
MKDGQIVGLIEGRSDQREQRTFVHVLRSAAHLAALLTA